MTTALSPRDLATPAAAESLDPEDWEAFRETAHRLLDRMIDHHREARERPAWRPVPAAVEQRLREGPPRTGQGAERAYRDFLELVLPYPTGNTHPRFWGCTASSATAA